MAIFACYLAMILTDRALTHLTQNNKTK